MKSIGIAVLILVVAAIALQAQQGAGMWTNAVNMPIVSTATSSGCNAVAAGVTNWCRTGTQELVSINGAAYVVVWPSQVTSPTLTLQGVTKTLPASFTLSTPTTVSAQ